MGNYFKRTAAALAVAVAAFAIDVPCSLTARAANSCGIDHNNELKAEDLNGGALSAGKYYLEAPLTLSEQIEITGNVTICLNGQNITAAGSRVFYVNGGTLTLCDCKETGEISGGAVGNDYGGAVYVDDKGKFIMEGGTISKSSAKHGGGVYVNNGGAFTMNGGTISVNTANHQGGGVFVNSDATFTMRGGTISGNKATEPTVEEEKKTAGGAGVYTAGAFTMNGGSISNNTSNYYGGGVLVSGSKAKFTLDNGTLSGNDSKTYGGGVHVSSLGTVIMNGGTIEHNEATNGAGGVSMGGGEFTMKGGSISSNKAKYGGGVRLSDGSAKFRLEKGAISDNEATDGGGLYLSGGTFEVSNNGKLSNNSAANNGGGVFLDNGALNLSGGEIMSNTAKLGSCVYMNKTENNDGGTMTLSGKVTITSNSDSNVYLKTGKTITIGSGFNPTEEIGIHPEIAPADCKAFVPAATFASGVRATNISDKFKADKEHQIVVYKNNEIELMGEHNYDTENWVNTDPTNHWHECTVCNDKIDNDKHIWDEGVRTKEPTPTEAGEIKYTCTVCGYEKISPIRINSPSSSSGSGGSSGGSSGSKVTTGDEDNSVTSAHPNPPTGHNSGVTAALAIIAAAAVLTRKRR